MTADRAGVERLPVRVDVVIFTLRDRDLRVCLVPASASGRSALPVAALHAGEALEAAARRQAEALLGVREFYLQQLYTFDPAWHSGAASLRVAYFALISADKLATAPAAQADWHSVYALPPLTPDHAEVLDYALTRLRYKIEYSAVAFELLPAVFTLRELQEAYMVILNDYRLDKANFRKKIREAQILEEVSGLRATGGRPARLFRFREDAQLETKARRFFP